ncbi:hypothetical protein QCA50_007373 [Cerrena zonata]|uniref:Uncharacterized protein n=1 Tax=Cerrena zonata TaxID=2478898 RepID=A0AAW0GJD0_9APHY
MLFSKLFVPLVAIFGFATVAFATPIAEPAPLAELETRDTQATGATGVMSALQELQAAVSPIVSQLSQAAATGQDPTPLLNNLRDTFTTHTTNIKKFSKNTVVAKADVTAVVSISLNIFLSIILVLGKFSIISVILSAHVDVFLSTFFTALDVVAPGVAAAVGAGIPSANVGLLVVLRLVAVINIFGLGGLLGGLLGIIGL